MKLIDIRIDEFGKLNNRYISFSDGINLVAGHNEAGKSTMHACIRAMLFGMERAKGVAALTDTFAHFKPWGGKKYGATLRVEHDGQIYRITRDFVKDPVSCAVINESTGEIVTNTDAFMADMLKNMSAAAYDNTISIGQLKSNADEAVADELKKYIVNMDTTGNRSLNCENAKRYLTAQKRKLAEDIVPDAARRLTANLSEIKNIEKELDNPEYISRLNELEDERREAVKSLEANEAEIKVLDEDIRADREILSKTGTETGSQAENDETFFLETLDGYEKEIAGNSIFINRALYIAFFAISLIAVLAGAYLLGAGLLEKYILWCEIAVAAGLVGGIIFLILCIRVKSRLKKKAIALSGLMVKYTGYEEIMPERINRVKEKIDEIKTIANNLEAKESKLTDLNKSLADLTQKDAELDKSIEKQRQTQLELMQRLNRINVLRRENETLKLQAERNDEIRNEMEAIDMAAVTIEELSIKMKDSLGVHLNREASDYVKNLTAGAYDSMSIDDNLDVFLFTENKIVPIEQLSSGTSDQVYMALRFAGARLVQDGKDDLPLILDDSFVNYDEDRLASTLRWMSGEYNGQIIIFSCHQREEKIMTAENIEFHKVEL